MEPDIIPKSVQKIHEWLDDICERGGWQDRKRGLAALRAALHELRDHLPLQECAHLSAELPLFVRGLFFENWQPEIHPPKERRQEDFLKAVEERLGPWGDMDGERTARAVFQTLANKIDPEFIEKIRDVLPRGIRPFWGDA
jgi:uncharacterized protein (DUF2267 family)